MITRTEVPLSADARDMLLGLARKELIVAELAVANWQAARDQQLDGWAEGKLGTDFWPDSQEAIYVENLRRYALWLEIVRALEGAPDQ
jgi:hypothetical protein